jgi:hypothetical protein
MSVKGNFFRYLDTNFGMRLRIGAARVNDFETSTDRTIATASVRGAHGSVKPDNEPAKRAIEVRNRLR